MLIYLVTSRAETTLWICRNLDRPYVVGGFHLMLRVIEGLQWLILLFIRSPFGRCVSFILLHTFFVLEMFYNSVINIQTEYIVFVFDMPVSDINCCFPLK